MDILLGTTNKQKAAYFQQLLGRDDLRLMTLQDVGVDKIPDEDGTTPMENAMRKAKWYGQFAGRVISEDSGLYFLDLPLRDPRQPGLFIRRAADGYEMTDEEMIEHYARLVESLGGRCVACYLDGYAVCRDGKVYGYMEDAQQQRRAASFLMLSKPHPGRHPGWPLDSLSADHQGRYWMDLSGDGWMPEMELRRAAKEKLLAFLYDKLGIE